MTPHSLPFLLFVLLHRSNIKTTVNPLYAAGIICFMISCYNTISLYCCDQPCADLPSALFHPGCSILWRYFEQQLTVDDDGVATAAGSQQQDEEAQTVLSSRSTYCSTQQHQLAHHCFLRRRALWAFSWTSSYLKYTLLRPRVFV